MGMLAMAIDKGVNIANFVLLGYPDDLFATNNKCLNCAVQFEETSRKGNSAREAVARLDIERKGIQLQLDGIVKQLSNYSQQIAEHKAKFTDLEPGKSTPRHDLWNMLVCKKSGLIC